MDETLTGGQCFSWAREGKNQWVGIVDGSIVRLRLSHGQLAWQASLPTGLTDRMIGHYLWLDKSYEKAVDSLPWRGDAVIRRAMEEFPGLRILRQPVGEALLTFLLSSAKSIPQIKSLTEKIYRTKGEKLEENKFAFPGWAKLKNISEPEARKLGLGYRAKYLVGVARFLDANPGWLEELSKIDYLKARKYLMELPGVGPKVADCVLLFGANKTEAFPIDTWIYKSLQNQYGMTEWKIEQMQDFAKIHFGRYAGLAQQFLFSYQRKLGPS